MGARPIVAAILLILVLPLAGVLGQTQTARARILVMGILNEPPTLVPYYNSGLLNVAIYLLYESLIQAGDGYSMKPRLASSWDISADRRTYTFHLVDAKWQDGVPFTSEDVKFTWQFLWDQKMAAQAYMAPIDQILTPDPHTVTIVFKQPAPVFAVMQMRYWACILPAHIFKGTNMQTNPATTTNPVGLGPFKLAEWKHGEYLRYVKNENYYKQGKPLLDEVIVNFYKDPSVVRSALQAKEIDYWPIADSSVMSELMRPPWNASVITYQGWALMGQLGMGINLDKGAKPLRDQKVREALAHAVDRKSILNLTQFGIGRVHYTFVPWIIPGYQGPDFSVYDYNLQKAASLLDDAAYKPDSTGTRFTLRIAAVTGNYNGQSIVQILRDDFGKIGIKLNIELYDTTTFIEKTRKNRDFDLELSTVNYAPLGLGMRYPFHSSSIGIPAYVSNFMGFNNSRVDNLLDAVQVEPNDQARNQELAQIMQIIVQQIPDIPLIAGPYLFSINSYVKGVDMTDTPDIGRQAYEDTYISQEVSAPPFLNTSVLVAGIVVVAAIIAFAAIRYSRRQKTVTHSS